MFYNSLCLISRSVTIYITYIKLPQGFVPLGIWGAHAMSIFLSLLTLTLHLGQAYFLQTPSKWTSKFSVVLTSQGPKENDAMCLIEFFIACLGYVVWGMGDLKTCHHRLLWSVCIGDNQTSFISLLAWSKMGHSWPDGQNYFLSLGPRN